MKRPVWIISLYLIVSGVRPDVIIVQPPILTSALGQNITLPCHVQVSKNTTMTNSKVVYWSSETKDLWPPSEEYKNRVNLLNQGSESLNKSIRLKHVQWEDNGKYLCKVSITTKQMGSFRKKGSSTELRIYGRILFHTTSLNNSQLQLQCKVPVSRHQGFTLSISSDGKTQPSSSFLNTSALYDTLSQTISLRKHQKYVCSLNFNGTLVTSLVYQDQLSGEEYPEPWLLYGGLILVQLIFLFVMTIVMLRNSCTNK